MNALQFCNKKISIVLLIGLSVVTLRAESILEYQIAQFRNHATPEHRYQLRYRANVLENAGRLIDAVNKNNGIMRDIQIDYLNPFLLQIINRINPSSILGTIVLSNMLQQSIAQKIATHVENFIQERELINHLKHITQSVPDLDNTLKTKLEALNGALYHIFWDGHMFGQWIKLEDQPSIQQSYSAKVGEYVSKFNMGLFGAGAVTTGLQWGLAKYAPLALSTVTAGYVLPTYWLPATLAGFGLMYKNQDENTALQAEKYRLTTVKGTMELFLKTIKSYALEIQTIIRTSNNPLMQRLANDLELPATIPATWHSVRDITRVLNIIGLFDASLSFVRAERNGLIAPVQHKLEHIVINEQTTLQGLQALWHATGKENNIEYQQGNNFIYIKLQNDLFLPNIMLANTLGYIVHNPIAPLPNNQPIIPLGSLIVSTKTTYCGTRKQESLEAITIPFTQVPTQ